MHRYDYAVGFATPTGHIAYGGDIFSSAVEAQEEIKAYGRLTNRPLFLVRRVHAAWEPLKGDSAYPAPLWWEGPFKDDGCVVYCGAEEVAVGLTEAEARKLVGDEDQGEKPVEFSEVPTEPAHLASDPQGLTNYTGCRILADLYGGEAQGIELLRTDTGAWYSTEAIRHKHHHSSSEVRLLRVISIVPLEVEAAAIAYVGGKREWARASEGFRATVLKKMQEALEAAKTVRP
jgi:hypothetical protein